MLLGASEHPHQKHHTFYDLSLARSGDNFTDEEPEDNVKWWRKASRSFQSGDTFSTHASRATFDVKAAPRPRDA